MNEAVYIPAILVLTSFFAIAAVSAIAGIALMWAENRIERPEH